MRKVNLLLIMITIFVFSTLAVQSAAAVDYTTAVPLPELGTDTYFGEQGGLYPGSNEPTGDYLTELTAVSDVLVNDNQVVALSLGMSAMQNMSSGFAGCCAQRVTFVNGAIGSKQQQWEDPNHTVWDRGTQMLAGQGLTAVDVDVVLYHNTIGGLSGEFVPAATQLKDSLAITMDIIQDKYPNAQMILLTSRYHANYAPAGSKSPEPYAYYSGFSVKWLIEDRINCTADCGVPLAWFAYLWDESWPQSWYVSDGIHLSNAGKTQAGLIWQTQMNAAAHIAPWYLGSTPPTATATQEPTAVPSSTPTPTVPGGTATPTPFPSNTPLPTVGATVTRGNGCSRGCQTATAEAGN